MKKYLKFLMLLPFVALLAACNLGDSEPVGKYAFETDAQKILIEAKLPSGVYDTDEIYICGPFNGAEAESYVEDAKWRLSQSSVNINIFGVYLDPATFVEGTSLADGFWFYSKNSGLSLTTKKEMATYTSNADLGQRTSVVVSVWGEPVKEYIPTLPDHPGTIRVYVENQAGWEAIALYQWGTENNLGGGWPGMQPTGTEVINEVEYTYFEYKVEDVDGKSQNLIFNNNGGGIQTADIPLTFSADVVDHFYRIFNEKDWEIIENPLQVPEKLPEHEGTIRVYADNQAGWEAIALYQWGTENNLGGGWPGMQPTGTETIAGVEYTYFEYAVADVDGKEQNLIFNNNGGGVQTADMPVVFSADVVDHFFVIYNEKDCAVIEDPLNREPVGETPENPEPENPEPENPDPETPADPVPVYFYVQDNTGWEVTNIYAWGDALPELFGGWPGAALETEVTCGGVAYNVVESTATAYDLVYHPIINGSGAQYDTPLVTLAKYNFLVAGEASAELGTAPAVKVYVDDQTGWDAIAVYSWGDGEPFGGWPGGTYATETVDGTDYKVFTVPAEFFGGSCNLIFNNNGGGTQLSDYNVRADRDYFLTVTAEGVTPIE